MKILTLTAENVKRLVAVEIIPDGHLVQITGKNGHGKTYSLALIAEMAKERDYQVWMERVDDTGRVGIVIEDGHVKGHGK